MYQQRQNMKGDGFVVGGRRKYCRCLCLESACVPLAANGEMYRKASFEAYGYTRVNQSPYSGRS
jgi:hypothetical protein